MAKCPNCELEIKWDFCGDIYIDENGNICKETQIVGRRENMSPDNLPIEIDDIEVFMQQCPRCNKILGFSVLQDNVIGNDQFTCEEWDGINWDSKEHGC